MKANSRVLRQVFFLKEFQYTGKNEVSHSCGFSFGGLFTHLMEIEAFESPQSFLILLNLPFIEDAYSVTHLKSGLHFFLKLGHS